MRIILLFLAGIEKEVSEELKENLNKIFNLPVEIESQIVSLDFAYNQKRGQYLGSAILSYLKNLEIDPNNKYLSIVGVDLYSPSLNFIFGEADPISGLAIISLSRLRHEFYGLPKNEKLLKERVLKEAVHELGHLFGLNHCQNQKCVMYFSNSLLDTDRKSSSFCSLCQKRIIQSS